MYNVYQILLIAYLTGFLWLRRNPLSLVFTAISPFSILFILFVVSNGQYVQFAVAGSLVMALVGYGLALGQDISLYKIEYKMQDIFVASPVSSVTYMLGLALSELLYGLPALMVLIVLALYFSTSLAFLPLLLINVVLIWGTMSSIGFFLSSHMIHMRNATQLISFVNVVIAVVPPVFYSIDRLPESLQLLSYVVPTTHASLLLQYSMGFPVPQGWSISLGLAVQGLYFIFFLIIAKKKALWREK
ncbi:ABC transporter permease [Candidatus Nitrosocosmicus agrestis]|jgi:ABC-2 type transport system permease protein|uniref:ABC transporter permease n=1 Tax=Candidatus Nitrosocosmicus agrestis TaxID=2563600 RepID=UPI00122DCD0E|nr:ABC transporter permease [Candidatus Nitrosocosmicus sp. SS]KAA2282715.1 ABC transporter permease [Candidatus Nitrosocosmicus sp. SS]KAF0870351.1 ABC transporter permease [Candidatus Nitrosocosmicus sp. SS]MDR4491039.1 ABC transporter permease [Candidatus Nitrosocosmicus sp.]